MSNKFPVNVFSFVGQKPNLLILTIFLLFLNVKTMNECKKKHFFVRRWSNSLEKWQMILFGLRHSFETDIFQYIVIQEIDTKRIQSDFAANHPESGWLAHIRQFNFQQLDFGQIFQLTIQILDG